MPTENEVKPEYERVEVAPSEDDELVEGQEEQSPESSPSEDEQGAAEVEPKEEEQQQEESASQPEAAQRQEPKAVDGETPRESALRKELERQRASNANLRRQQFSSITRQGQPEQPRPRVNPDEVLKRYKPEEIEEVQTLFDAVGAKMGFVRQQDIAQQTYQTTAESTLQGFLDEHPEYKAENDPDNANWNKFREAYQMYRPPADPKAYAKIFQSIHRDIFGIQSTDGLKKTAAAREKVRMGSHGQGARQTGTQRPAVRQPATQLDPGLRQHLKGDFSDIFGNE